MFTEKDVIYCYSRAQAIDDGVLVDVSDAAREAGFKYSVALTCAVFNKYVVVPHGVNGQDESGRLWDILTILRYAIRGGNGGSELRFRLHIRNDNSDRTPIVEMKAICGPDDDGNPCLTVLLPDEY